jgi:hypothetical protein
MMIMIIMMMQERNTYLEFDFEFKHPHCVHNNTVEDSPSNTTM